MKNFAEREKTCEMMYEMRGPYWHVYTSGKETPVLFATKEDLSFVMNVVAQAALEFRPTYGRNDFQTSGVVIIAFEVMNNHLHFILSGSKEDILAFFAFIKRRLSRTIRDARCLEANLKSIDNLVSLRNNIVYVNRNGYVADPNYTPFNYPWGTGRFYFNDIPTHTRYSDLKLTPKRQMFRGRAPELPGDWAILDRYVAPSSYCSIQFGMGVFRDAHQYFNLLGKNVEAYQELALEFGDTDFLTDSELFVKVASIVRETYRLTGIRDLSKAQKLDLARTLHYDYRSSNGQIRRILGLSQNDVNSLFPLSAE